MAINIQLVALMQLYFEDQHWYVSVCPPVALGYLNELQGAKCYGTSGSSDSTWSTQPNHQFC